MQKLLESISLGQYSENFIEAGYDEESDMKHLEETDLDKIGIPLTKPGHRKRLLQLASDLRKQKRGEGKEEEEEEETENTLLAASKKKQGEETEVNTVTD